MRVKTCRRKDQRKKPYEMSPLTTERKKRRKREDGEVARERGDPL